MYDFPYLIYAHIAQQLNTYLLEQKISELKSHSCLNLHRSELPFSPLSSELSVMALTVFRDKTCNRIFNLADCSTTRTLVQELSMSINSAVFQDRKVIIIIKKTKENIAKAKL
ncbi:hypothetical protein Leryth_002611 [Lithospermum erythrorhizon]|nr:hypothetical protein Leryth_002611 [Lithospermum erythrorhizon]